MCSDQIRVGLSYSAVNTGWDQQEKRRNTQKNKLEDVLCCGSVSGQEPGFRLCGITKYPNSFRGSECKFDQTKFNMWKIPSG